MSGHLIEHVTVTTEAGVEVSHHAACLCGQVSGPCTHHWQAEDWAGAHLATVRRARAALGRTPSLRNVGLYYRKMSEDPQCTDKEKAEWTLLAEEIEARVLRMQPLSDDDQLPLF